jgi:hypothetical protein
MKTKLTGRMPTWALVIVGIIAVPFIMATAAISAAYCLGRVVCEEIDKRLLSRK